MSLRDSRFLELSKEQAEKVWEYGIDIISRTEEEVYYAEII